jgi:hypothetical protein
MTSLLTGTIWVADVNTQCTTVPCSMSQQQPLSQTLKLTDGGAVAAKGFSRLISTLLLGLQADEEQSIGKRKGGNGIAAFRPLCAPSWCSCVVSIVRFSRHDVGGKQRCV